VRFGISHVLDAIERQVGTDPAADSAVLDLGEVIRMVDLDGGRPAQLIRLGLVIDAVAKHLGDSSASVFVIADRVLLSDTDLTANEKIVIRRWSDDGLIEVIGTGGPPAAVRAREVAALTGLPLVSRQSSGYPGLTYAPSPQSGGAQLNVRTPGPGPAFPAAVLGRMWRCPEPDCPSFGGAHDGQPPAHLGGGKPRCPRHGAPLADLGGRPREVACAIRVKGIVWHRFTVSESAPVVIGRSPDGEGIGVGMALDERGLRWVSRAHIRLDLRGSSLSVTDTSTNGSTVVNRSGPGDRGQQTSLGRGESAPITEWSSVVLYEDLEIGYATRSPGAPSDGPAGSVMAEAPTQAIRLPGN
jgi:hypothetical protein